ncbi:hypothetical protein HRbin19_00657 [bacterium HR19]|nr:hypothetical protein HRbin19_00657 [bacterium HR19]
MEITEESIGQILKYYLPIIFVTFSLFLPLIILKPHLGIFFISMLIPISPSVVVGQTHVRDITLRFEDIFFVMTLISWALRGFSIPKGGEGFKISNIIIFLFLLYGISTFLHLNIYNWKGVILFYLKYAQYFFYFILAYSFVRGESDAKLVALGFFIGVSLALLYWIPEIMKGKIGNEVRFPFHKEYGGRENVGIFSLGIMAISFPFILSSKGYKKVLLIIIFALSAVVYFRTLSRASYLAGVAWLIFSLFYIRKTSFFISVLVLIVVFPFIVPDYVIDRIKYTFEGTGGGKILGSVYVESSLFVRWERWKYFIFEQLPESPIFGFGILGVGLMDSQYLRVWGEGGTAGLIIFLILLYRIFKFLKRTNRLAYGSEFLFSFSFGLFSWFVSILFHMIGANTFVILQTSEMFWLLLGTLAGVERNMHNNEKLANEKNG